MSKCFSLFFDRHKAITCLLQSNQETTKTEMTPSYRYETVCPDRSLENLPDDTFCLLLPTHHLTISKQNRSFGGFDDVKMIASVLVFLLTPSMIYWFVTKILERIRRVVTVTLASSMRNDDDGIFQIRLTIIFRWAPDSKGRSKFCRLSSVHLVIYLIISVVF